MPGILCLDRDHFLGGAFAQESRCFSRYEAHLDLYSRAAHSAHSQLIGGKLIHLKIGEQIASERYLEKRWNWSRTKVRSFLQILRDIGELNQRKDQGETAIMLCRYEDLTRNPAKKEPANRPTENQGRTKEEPKEKTLEAGETLNKELPSAPLPHGPAFTESWGRWTKHRSEIRKPLKPTMIESQIKKLAAMSEADAVAMLDYSTANGYQGLFAPRDGDTPKPASPAPKSGEIKCAGRTGFVVDTSKVEGDLDLEDEDDIPF